jgi:hypothetical protein
MVALQLCRTPSSRRINEMRETAIFRLPFADRQFATAAFCVLGISSLQSWPWIGTAFICLEDFFFENTVQL